MLFDFDGTLTSKDSFISFLHTVNSPLKFIAGLIFLSPVLIGYVAGILPNWKAKQIVMHFFFAGIKAHDFFERSRKFSEQQIPLLVKENAMKRWISLIGMKDREASNQKALDDSRPPQIGRARLMCGVRFRGNDRLKTRVLMVCIVYTLLSPSQTDFTKIKILFGS